MDETRAGRDQYGDGGAGKDQYEGDGIGRDQYGGDIPSIKVPSRPWKPGKSGDLNCVCPGTEKVWNLPKIVRKP